MLVVAGILLAFDGNASSPDKWRDLSEQTRTRMQEMDEIIRDPVPERGYEAYMELFSRNVQAHGLHESGAANLDGLREHYRPVFFELQDGVLISDEVIVAGPMAAQRYHSMLYLRGEFDGIRGRREMRFPPWANGIQIRCGSSDRRTLVKS